MTAQKKKTNSKKTKKKATKKAVKKSVVSIPIKDSPKKKAKKKTTKKKRVPANAKWKDEYLPLIKRLIVAGLYDHEIADIFGVCEKTYHNWKRLYLPDEELQSMKELKKDKCKSIVRSLEQLAQGYIAREDKAFMTKGGTIKTVKLVKQYPPHMGAIGFYLGNRDPENWRKEPDKPEDPENNKRSKSFGFTFNEEAEPL